MYLAPGEYVFECLECSGDGSYQVIVGPEETESTVCSHCHGEGVVYVDEEVAAEYVDNGYMPLRKPSMMNRGKEVCPRCGTTFDAQETRANFDHQYRGSAEWEWDDLPERLCWDCAETDVENRWMGGTFVAADGPPPSDAVKYWKKLRR